LTAAASEPAGQAPQVYDRDGVIYFQGQITRASADAFLRLLGPDTKRLVMASGGGEAAPALDIAEAIQARRLPVEVRDLCFSACAVVVLVASPDRTVGAGAIIGLHGSPLAAERGYQRTGLAAPPELAPVADRMRALYARAGVSTELLYCSAERIGFTNRHATRQGPDGPQDGWLTRFAWWLPRDDDLRRFGLAFERVGPPPEPERIAEPLSRRIGVSAKRDLVLGLPKGTCR
jgi:hypothetical protein